MGERWKHCQSPSLVHIRASRLAACPCGLQLLLAIITRVSEGSLGFLSFVCYSAAAPALSAIADYKGWHMPKFVSILFPEELDIDLCRANTSCSGPCGPLVSVSVTSDMICMVAV